MKVTTEGEKESDDALSCPDAVTDLLEKLIEVLEESRDLLDEAFGPTAILVTLKALQVPLDLYTARILDTFLDVNHVQKLVIFSISRVTIR